MQTDNIDISKLNPADVLAALYNNSRPLGLGILHFKPEDMKQEEAQALLDEQGERNYFDYLKGRVMKISIKSPLRTGLYDRDNGDGAALAAIQPLLDAVPV